MSVTNLWSNLPVSHSRELVICGTRHSSPDRPCSLVWRVGREWRGCSSSCEWLYPSADHLVPSDRAQKTLGVVGGTPDYIPVPGFEVPDVLVRSHRYSADGRLYAYALPNL